MSKLSDIEARDRFAGFLEPEKISAKNDRRYLLGLVKDARAVAKQVRDSQESDLGAYSRWVGYMMADLIKTLEE